MQQPETADPLNRMPAGDPCREHAQVRELYVKHSGSLIRQIALRTGCSELARDLAHEAFQTLLKPGRLGAIEKPENYLRRVAANLVKDWGREKMRAEKARPALEYETDKFVDQVAILESRDTLRLLEQVVSRMKPRTREIFLANRVEGLSCSEIAERLGLKVRGVEKQMSKAIAKIDRALNRR